MCFAFILILSYTQRDGTRQINVVSCSAISFTFHLRYQKCSQYCLYKQLNNTVEVLFKSSISMFSEAIQS
jgi:hypothetical protein